MYLGRLDDVIPRGGLSEVPTTLFTRSRGQRHGLNRALRPKCRRIGRDLVDDLMGENETNLAPVIIRVAEKRMLAATCMCERGWRPETAKVVPKRIAYEVIKNGIERRELPAPEGGWKERMMDFGGVPGFLVRHRILPAWLEMQTLNCKLVKAEAGNFFLTSDHPAVLLNQLFMDAEPHWSYVGFSRSGFSASLATRPFRRSAPRLACLRNRARRRKGAQRSARNTCHLAIGRRTRLAG
jgi:hypothetical protein